jgi:hypothetical protein
MRICPQCKNKRSFPSNRQLCSGCRTFNNRIRRGEILPPDYKEVTISSYKEPLEKVSEGYGYIGAITKTKDNDKIQCHLCGFFFRNLAAHIKSKHDISCRDYKYKFGLRITEGLLSPNQRKEFQKTYNTHVRSISAKGIAAIKQRREINPWKTGGPTWSAQTRNEKGMCREQTLAKIKHLANISDGIATYKDFMILYGQGQKSVIEHWFGSWDKAVKAAGLSTYRGRLKQSSDHRKEDLLDKMRVFYELHGRTPLYSDFNALDMFPSSKWVSTNFGTLNGARLAAGVPVLVKVAGRKWVEQTR